MILWQLRRFNQVVIVGILNVLKLHLIKNIQKVRRRSLVIWMQIDRMSFLIFIKGSYLRAVNITISGGMSNNFIRPFWPATWNRMSDRKRLEKRRRFAHWWPTGPNIYIWRVLRDAVGAGCNFFSNVFGLLQVQEFILQFVWNSEKSLSRSLSFSFFAKFAVLALGFSVLLFKCQ